MTVYVDDLFPTGRTRQWPYAQACHLFADSYEELHAFAARIGLKRAWFQPRERHVGHYDLTPGKRAEAQRLGAVALDDRATVTKWHEIIGVKP